MLNPEEGVCPNDFNMITQVQGGSVLFDQADGWKMLFQQDGVLCSPAQRLQANRSGSCKQIDDQSVFYRWSDQIKGGFTDPVFHGSSSRIATVLDGLTAQSATDNPDRTH